MDRPTQPGRQPYVVPAGGYYPPQPYPLRKPASPGLVEHIRRTLTADVRGLPGSAWEHQRLLAAGVTEPRVQALLAWRRSCMLVVLPILAVTFILTVVELGMLDTTGVSEFGVFVSWLQVLSMLLLPLGAVLALASWTELRRSSRQLVICWAVSVVIPILVALVPPGAMLDLGSQATERDLMIARTVMAIGYALSLMPVIVTLPAGLIRGASRAKSLFPASMLPGWFLVAVAPFYSLFLVVAFVVIHQLAGNALLMIAVGLFAVSPWFFVLRRRTYARPMSSAEAAVELGKASYVRGGILIVGSLLLVIFLATATVGSMPVLGAGDEAILGYYQVSRVAMDVFARSIFATVVFCLLFVQMIYREWAVASTMTPAVQQEHFAEMHSLRRYAEGTRTHRR